MKLEEAYSVLELQAGCDSDEIKKAFRQQALKWHPDKNSNSTESTEKFQSIQCAYDKLTRYEDDDDYSDDSSDDLSEEDLFGFPGGIPPWEFLSHIFGRGSSFPFGCARPRSHGYRPRDSYAEKWWQEEKEKMERDRCAEQAEKAERMAKATELQSKRSVEAWLNQMPRPTMVSQSNRSIKLELFRRGVECAELPSTCLLKLEKRKSGDSGWTALELDKDTKKVTVDNLDPGTSYTFRVCGGQRVDGEVRWGEWSMEFRCATTGKSRKAASAGAKPKRSASHPTPPSAPEKEGAGLAGEFEKKPEGNKENKTNGVPESHSGAPMPGKAQQKVGSKSKGKASKSDAADEGKEGSVKKGGVSSSGTSGVCEEEAAASVPPPPASKKKKKAKAKDNGGGKTSVHRPEVTPTVPPPVQSSEPDHDGPAADTDAENPEEASAQVAGNNPFGALEEATEEAQSGAPRSRQSTQRAAPPPPAKRNQPTATSNTSTTYQMPTSAAAARAAVAASMAEQRQTGAKSYPPPVCHFHNTRQGCKWGANCKFQHIDGQSGSNPHVKARPPPPPPSRPGGAAPRQAAHTNARKFAAPHEMPPETPAATHGEGGEGAGGGRALESLQGGLSESEAFARAMEESLAMYNESVAADKTASEESPPAQHAVGAVSEKKYTATPQNSHDPLSDKKSAFPAEHQQPIIHEHTAQIKPRATTKRPISPPRPPPPLQGFTPGASLEAGEGVKSEGGMVWSDSTAAPTQQARQPRVCKFHGTAQGCSWGQNCRFQHVDSWYDQQCAKSNIWGPTTVVAPPPPPPPVPPQNAPGFVNPMVAGLGAICTPAAPVEGLIFGGVMNQPLHEKLSELWSAGHEEARGVDSNKPLHHQQPLHQEAVPAVQQPRIQPFFAPAAPVRPPQAPQPPQQHQPQHQPQPNVPFCSAPDAPPRYLPMPLAALQATAPPPPAPLPDKTPLPYFPPLLFETAFFSDPL